jgi:hypothetical protein
MLAPRFRGTKFPTPLSNTSADSRPRLGRGNILRIGIAEAAVATQGRLALLNGGEPTILAAEAGVICTPRIILSLCWGANLGCHNENCQHEGQNSHGLSPGVALGALALTLRPRHYFRGRRWASPRLPFLPMKKLA